MRPERNPLDLNNLPDDFSRDGNKQPLDDTSSSVGYRKKKSGGKDGKDESGKVYECRFCSLKFCKSQALGGHMNRHRQERETETLNRARQLVFSSDNLAAAPPSHLGCHPVVSGGYHPSPANFRDPYRSIYPPRLARVPPFNDYYIGHVLNNQGMSYGSSDSNYTCIGAPVRHNSGGGSSRGADQDQEQGLNWGKSYATTDPGSFSFNRFQDGI